MKKILLIIIIFTLFIFRVNAVDKSLKVYDFNQNITVKEEEKLRKSVKEYIRKYNIDMALITIKHYEQDTTLEYADKFFRKNDFGINESKDVIIFIIDYSDNTKLEIFTNGKATDVYSNFDKAELINSVDLNDKPYKIFNKLIDKSSKYKNNYKEYFKYIIFTKITKKDYIVLAILSLILSGCVMLLLILRSRNNLKEKDNYKKIDLHMVRSSDKFINTHTEAYRFGGKK